MAALAMGAMSASAQTAIEEPGFFDNFDWSGWWCDHSDDSPCLLWQHAWSGRYQYLQAGHTGICPGVEGAFGVNTSSWRNRVHSSTAFDNSYVGAFGAVDLFNLLEATTVKAVCSTLMSWPELVGTPIYQSGDVPDHNYFGNKGRA